MIFKLIHIAYGCFYHCLCVDCRIYSPYKCNKCILQSKVLTAEEIRKSWVNLVMNSPLNTPKCPYCNNSTSSDYNLDTTLKIFDGTKEIKFEDLKNEDNKV